MTRDSAVTRNAILAVMLCAWPAVAEDAVSDDLRPAARPVDGASEAAVETTVGTTAETVAEADADAVSPRPEGRPEFVTEGPDVMATPPILSDRRPAPRPGPDFAGATVAPEAVADEVELIALPPARALDIVVPVRRPSGGALPPSLRDPDAFAVGEAMAEIRSGDWAGAKADVDDAGEIGHDIVEWHRLRAGRGTFDEVLAFLDRRPDWPGLDLLRRRAERSVPTRDRAEDVLAFFADAQPETADGALAYALALSRSDRGAEAEAVAIAAWRGMPMTAGQEDRFLANWGAALVDHHVARLDWLLWDGEADAAERMYSRVPDGWRALGRARLALRGNRSGTDALVEAVPAALADDPGLAYERFAWRARKGRGADALDIVLQRDADELGQPERWAAWRLDSARAMMRGGDAKTAYAVAATHGLTAGSNFAELEWLAGYLALTYLDRPADALEHFRHFGASVDTPISLGRAGYWEGRALEAMGDADAAQAAYAEGGRWQTSFYGQLAAERAMLPMDEKLAAAEPYPNWRTQAFADSSVMAAGDLLLRAGETTLAERFLSHLAESLTEAEIGSLMAWVLDRGEAHVAVMIGKRAAQFGIEVPLGYFALYDFGLEGMVAPEAWALSIARRESEFDPVVMSHAGARGLMQLMPGTAREVATELGLRYSQDRLTSDPAYNARLGTEYLSWLLENFHGNAVLASLSYNAGAGRAYDWIEERGDPRSGNVDVIDWIEHIPFDETRNYVMRVSESLVVYKARLAGHTMPWTLTAELTRKDRVRPRSRAEAVAALAEVESEM